MARVIVAIALALVVVMGMAAVGCNGVDGNGNIPNDEYNGEMPNGEVPNGDEPAEPDLSGLGLVADCDENTGENPEVGDPAIDFRFQDAIGTTFSLSDFRGRPVVLNFWATWCPYCGRQLPHIQRVYDEWPATELVLLTLSKGEEPATVTTFMQDEGLTFPVVLDREQKASAQYRVSGIPTTFFIDEDGIIQFIKVGYFHSFEDIADILNQLTGLYGDEPAEPDLSGLGLVVDCDENTGPEPEAGDMAIDFRFQDAVGTTFALSDLRGRVVMLNFWTTGCGFCIEELPYIQQIHEQWPATELVLLTIDKGEEPAVVATFMQDEGLSFPVVVDREEKVSREYDVTSLPRTFFIDSEGIIQVIKRGYFHSLEDIEEILNQLISQ